MKHEVLAQEDAATAAAGFWMGFWPGLNRVLTQSRARRQCQVHRGGDDFDCHRKSRRTAGPKKGSGVFGIRQQTAHA